MTTIARGQASSPQNPVLSTFFLTPDGALLDPEVIEFAIFERITEEFPSQVYPPPGALLTRAPVSVLPAPAGDRLSPGRYVARWAPEEGQDVGRYEIRWWFRNWLTDLDEYTFVEEFEVVSHMRARGPAYALVDDLRAEGVVRSRLNDAELHAKIVRASKLFEHYTGRSFVPAYKTLRADGRGHGVLLLGEPIIAVEQVHYSGNHYYAGIGDYGRSLSRYRTFNRHITQGLTDPDDRENPRIEIADYGGGIAYGGRFSHGQQNIYVRGVFGYTDLVPGGALAGEVPELVAHAVKLLAFKDLPRLWDVADREDAQKRWKLTSESTREQSYGMLGGVDAATRGAVVGGTTGDPEIDNIIILYRRGGQAGAA